MTEFIMLVGLPASGKSTYAEQLKNKGYAIHSSDAIRKEIYGDESVQQDHNRVFTILHDRIMNDIHNGKKCVYDATNISSKRRKHFIDRLNQKKKYCNKKCVVFITDPYRCETYDAKRDRTVGWDVIYNMWKHFEIPYYYEGWDEIELRFDCDQNDWIAWEDIKLLETFDQSNPHHKNTLGIHLNATCGYCARNDFDQMVVHAAKFHDIGKPYCKTYKNTRGKNTFPVAHYYDHENISAYNTLLYLCERKFSDNDKLHIASLVGNHMKPYSWKLEKTKEKYKKLWGETYFNQIMELHEADVASH